MQNQSTQDQPPHQPKANVSVPCDQVISSADADSHAVDSHASDHNAYAGRINPILSYARQLLLAVEQYYEFIDEGKKKEFFIRYMLSQDLDTLFDYLAECEPCSVILNSIKLESISIDQIPTPKILDSIRQQAIANLTKPV